MQHQSPPKYSGGDGKVLEPFFQVSPLLISFLDHLFAFSEGNLLVDLAASEVWLAGLSILLRGDVCAQAWAARVLGTGW